MALVHPLPELFLRELPFDAPSTLFRTIGSHALQSCLAAGRARLRHSRAAERLLSLYDCGVASLHREHVSVYTCSCLAMNVCERVGKVCVRHSQQIRSEASNRRARAVCACA